MTDHDVSRLPDVGSLVHNAVEHVVGAAMQAMAREMTGRGSDDATPYAPGWDELALEGVYVADQAEAARPDIDARFAWDVLMRADAARFRVYRTPVHAGVLRELAETARLEDLDIRTIDPAWTVAPSPEDARFRTAAIAMDDVLAGGRTGEPDHDTSSQATRGLRRHRMAVVWAADAIRTAARESLPPLDDLYEAARLQVDGTRDLVEGNNIWGTPAGTSFDDRALHARPHLIAARAHLAEAERLVEQWRERYAAAFDAAAPEHLRRRVLQAGMGGRLGTTEREAARVREAQDVDAVRAFVEQHGLPELRRVPIEPAERPSEAARQLAANGRKRLMGLTMQAAADWLSQLNFQREYWYPDGALEELRRQGEQVVAAADAERPALLAEFKADVYRRAGAAQYEVFRVYGGVLPGIAPDWPELTPDSPSVRIKGTGSALDDVLAGKRNWWPDYTGSNNGIGELRAHPDAIGWLAEAIAEATPEVAPEALLRAEELQVEGTAKLLAAYQAMEATGLTPGQAARLLAADLEAGHELTSQAYETFEESGRKMGAALDHYGPDRLRTIVERAGFGDKLDVTQREARERVRQADAERDHAYLSQWVPRDQRTIPSVGADRLQGDAGPLEPPRSPAPEHERNDAERPITEPAAARVHPWVEAAAAREATPPREDASARSAREQTVSPAGARSATRLAPAAAAGLPDVSSHKSKASAPARSAPGTTAAQHTPNAASATDLGRTAPTHGRVAELARALAY
ncbi:MAG: hypothetical protein HOV68_28150 [Streptomycetaceae bacterium]|nr:hypothetical protein [Streptomycetaceae bacterium]